MIRRPPRSTLSSSSAASDVYKRQALVRLTTEFAGPCLEWLSDQHGIPFEVLEGFLYPGHSRLRMHTVPEHTGSSLLQRLHQSVAKREIPVLCEATVSGLFVNNHQKVHGVRVLRSDGSTEDLGCRTLVMACNGYGGNAKLLKRFIPELEGCLLYTSPSPRD